MFLLHLLLSLALAALAGHLHGWGVLSAFALLYLLCKLAYGLSAHGAARYLRSGRGQSWFNRISAGLFSGAGVLSLLKARGGSL